MFVKLTPQINSTNQIAYEYGQDSLVVTLDGAVDSFDFSSVRELRPEQIKTSLPINPIVALERVEGVLYLTLLNFVEGAVEYDRFPQFLEV